MTVGGTGNGLLLQAVLPSYSFEEEKFIVKI